MIRVNGIEEIKTIRIFCGYFNDVISKTRSIKHIWTSIVLSLFISPSVVI